MRTTIKWLKRYLKTNLSNDHILDLLNKIGFEVENIIDYKEKYECCIVGKVTEVRAHPDADKLKLCSVYNGSEHLQIVCGATNVKDGMYVCLANVGAKLNGLEIRKSKIRGVESIGMLCSADELGLTEDRQEGIMELDSTAKPGTSFSEYYYGDDVMIDLSVMPNRRQDCLSVRGLARDIAAAGGGEFCDTLFDAAYDIGDVGSIDILETDSCESILLCSIDLKEEYVLSSEIRRMMRAIGACHRLDLVTLSNYMMYDMGRPNHFYDRDKLSGGVSVRNSRQSEHFISLDDQEYHLEEGLLVVADDKSVIGLAGVMGSACSGIDENTRRILIEVADFASDAVMRSGRATMIHTDARMRFEAGVDKTLSHNTVSRLIALLGEVVDYNSIECSISGAIASETRLIEFQYSELFSIIGQNLTIEYVRTILTNLGFIFLHDDDISGKIKVPEWRLRDIATMEDIVEEVVRIYGINNIAPKPFAYSSMQEVYMHDDGQNIRGLFSAILRARGMQEVITWSFYGQEREIFGGDIKITNPINNDMAVMRASIVPQLMKVIQNAKARGKEAGVSIFEHGNVYSEGSERECISAARFGSRSPNGIHGDLGNWDYYDIREDMIALLAAAGLSSSHYDYDLSSGDLLPIYYHPKRSAVIGKRGVIIGYCGELHPRVKSELGFEIEEQVVIFECFADAVNSVCLDNLGNDFRSKYQASCRDMAFIVNNEVTSADIVDAVRGMSISSIRDIDIFDIYSGSSIGEGKKSVGVRIQIQEADRTMKEEEITAIMSSVATHIAGVFGGELRAL